jgi:transcriptional antiterminator RfaH
MPILTAEPNLYPPTLLELEPGMAGTDQCWWVLHTKPRQEKALARDLHGREVPYYLPLVSRRHRLRGRALTSHLPLFTSYLFLYATPEQRVAALATHRVVHSLPVANQYRLRKDLCQLRQLIDSGRPITPEERLMPGDLVEICNGPLAGLQGKILAIESRRRFVVEVDFIQKGASILLDELIQVRPAR